ncbi:NAD(+)/NADH kinase [bacterium BFN5]|nr:NAD(+)/NADH kinase [bacterium BFN5]
MRTIGIFPNRAKSGVTVVLDKIIKQLRAQSVKVFLPEETAASLGYSELALSRDIMKNQIDLAITLGGDGTLLSTTRDIAAAGIPICGINLGRLGFLTEVELPEVADKITKLIHRDYEIEDRLMLDAIVRKDGHDMKISSALNDVVITKGGFSRMLRLQLHIDDVFTANYQADGLIIATSTGSTGYSLSAGGPIINPNLKIVLITPICPHTLSARSLIISSDEKVRVTPESANADVVLTVDGQIVHHLNPGDEVIIQRTAYSAKFVKFAGKSYYETLRTKLWRGD